ncbi:hypothetical protein [Natronomonas amylolytica]|uniref:hypothetical protein n=1 Tax=Natronomonas amylolytica TaxID=3108498 RepID=UPI00300A3CA8
MAHGLDEVDDIERDTSPNDEPNDEPGTVRINRRAYTQMGVMGLLFLITGTGRTDASDTASGNQTGGLERHLLIRGRDDVTRYELTVDGRLAPGRDASSDADVRISGSSVEGIVRNEERRYRFSGEIRDMMIDGEAGVYIGTERPHLE